MRTKIKLIISDEPNIRALQIAVEEHVKNVFQDLSKGSSTHVIVTSAPATGDIENGEIRLLNGTDKRIYTKMGGALYYATLTAV